MFQMWCITLFYRVAVKREIASSFFLRASEKLLAMTFAVGAWGGGGLAAVPPNHHHYRQLKWSLRPRGTKREAICSITPLLDYSRGSHLFVFYSDQSQLFIVFFLYPLCRPPTFLTPRSL